MKTLSTLAVLSLTAAAQALTIDLQFGTGSVSTPLAGGAEADSSSIVGVGIGTQLTDTSHLGINLSTRDIVVTDPGNPVNAKARTAILEYTYELNPTGGIHPFIGAGIGYAWLKNTDGATALASDVFAGLRFTVTESVDLTFTARAHQLYNVDFNQGVQGEFNRQVNSFEAIAGLRFKF
jgi:opacity protein-like surface antigen